MASTPRRHELGIDAATDELMRRVYALLVSEGVALSVDQIQDLLDVPSPVESKGADTAAAQRAGERLSKTLETLVLVKAVETGPGEDGPVYRARPGIDDGEWRVPA